MSLSEDKYINTLILLGKGNLYHGNGNAYGLSKCLDYPWTKVAIATRKRLVRRALPPGPYIKEKAYSSFILLGTGNWCIYGSRLPWRQADKQ